MFNADDLCVEQHFATSADGTKIPYFVMRKKNLVMDGSNPVLLDAYGGFEISMLPGYSAGVGAGWLELFLAKKMETWRDWLSKALYE